MLLLKAIRDVRALGGRAVLIVAVIAAGAGTAAGIGQALRDVETTRDAFFADYALADLDVRLASPVLLADVSAAASNPDVARAEARLIAGGTVQLGGGETTDAEVVGMEPGAQLNRLDVVDGANLGALTADQVLVEADFAQFAGLSVNDRINLTVAGHSAVWQVAGLVRSPEYLLATANPDYLIPQRGSLAVVFMSRSRLQEVAGLTGQANDVVIDLAPGSTVQALLAGAGTLPVARLTPRSEQYSLRFTEADVKIFSVLAPVLGGVFAVSGLLLVMLSLLRLVDRQRRELGAMLALGYSRTAVVASVVLVAALLGIGGSVAGIGVTAGIGRLVSTEYATAVGFPATVHRLEPGSLGLCIAIALGAALLAAILPASRVVRLTPAVAMRGQVAGSARLPHWLERATERWTTPWAYATRSLVRRPFLTLATTVSVAAAIGLGVALHIVTSSSAAATDAAFADDSWTHTADLATPVSSTRAGSIASAAGIDQFEPVLEGPARLASETGESIGLQIVGIPPTGKLMALDVVAGSPPTSATVDLSEQTARSLGVSVGDRLAVATTAGTTRLTVGGVVRTLAANSAYTTIDAVAELLDRPDQVSTLLVVADPAEAATLRANPAVARVASKAQAQDGIHELVTELTQLINVMLVISLGVGTLFLVSSLSLAYLDRRDEFATLEAMGYGRRPVATIVAAETLLQAGAACLLAVPAGLLLATPLVARMGQAWFHIGIDASPSDFALIGPALLLALIPTTLTVRRLLRLNISETVRARMIG
jgi:putative ABC transport system permease protein